MDVAHATPAVGLLVDETRQCRVDHLGMTSFAAPRGVDKGVRESWPDDRRSGIRRGAACGGGGGLHVACRHRHSKHLNALVQDRVGRDRTRGTEGATEIDGSAQPDGSAIVAHLDRRRSTQRGVVGEPRRDQSHVLLCGLHAFIVGSPRDARPIRLARPRPGRADVTRRHVLFPFDGHGALVDGVPHRDSHHAAHSRTPLAPTPLRPAVYMVSFFPVSSTLKLVPDRRSRNARTTGH